MPAVAIPLSFVQLACPDFDGDMTKEQEARLRPVAKKLLETSIEQGVDPMPMISYDTIVGHQMNLTVDAAKSRVVRKLAKTHKVREGALLSAYILAGQQKDLHLALLTSTTTASALSPYTAMSGRQERPDQTTFFRNIMDSLSNHHVGLIEGATGVGKTLAMLASANEVAIKNDTKCLIGVPTVALIQQFSREYARLAAAVDMAPLKVVIGMREFVDTQALLAVVEQPEYAHCKNAVQQWLDGGAKAMGPVESLQHDYLVSAIVSQVPELPVSEFRLSPGSSEDEPGLATYQNQFVNVAEMPSIILATHSMIAIDIMYRMRQQKGMDEVLELKEHFKSALERSDKNEFSVLFNEHAYQLAMLAREAGLGKLPLFTHVLIDEAHLFEQNVSNTLTYHSSIHEFLRKVSANCSERFLKRSGITEKFERLRSTAHSDDTYINDDSSYALKVKMLLVGIFEPIANMKAGTEEKKALRNEAKFLLNRIAAKSAGQAVIVRFSPVRKYPQIIAGSRSLENVLKQFWYSMEGAACVSASLYYKKMETDSAGYYKIKLGIPSDKAKEYTPVIPAWQKKAIKALYLPTGEGLTPVSRRDKLSDEMSMAKLQRWQRTNASWLKHIADTAAGGTLVLLTSNADVERFYEILVNELDLPSERLVASRGINTFSQQKLLFVEKAEAKTNPIWLAVGGAWTGLDINGADYGISDPAKDNLLTDLVIPKLPFGMNKSLTHSVVSRRANGSQHEVLETSMLFKQGLGRLIRRSGLPENRRIWVMDNRLKERAFQGFAFSILRLIDTYRTAQISSVNDIQLMR